jgi:chaperone modulatory protein CbpM
MDDSVLLALQDLTRACAQPETWVVELVQVGILEPLPDATHSPSEWHFSAQSLFTARKVQRLQHDLGVNLEGAALALELMAQLDAMRASMQRAGLGD